MDLVGAITIFSKLDLELQIHAAQLAAPESRLLIKLIFCHIQRYFWTTGAGLDEDYINKHIVFVREISCCYLVTEKFMLGKQLHGSYNLFCDNKLLHHSNYHYGQKDGCETMYFIDDYSMSRSREYVNGKLHGLSTIYNITYYNRSICEEIMFIDEMPHGCLARYWIDGKVSSIETWDNEKRVSSVTYDAFGTGIGARAERIPGAEYCLDGSHIKYLK